MALLNHLSRSGRRAVPGRGLLAVLAAGSLFLASVAAVGEEAGAWDALPAGDLPAAAEPGEEAPDPRIVGGVEVDPLGKYPFMAEIVRRGINSYDGLICGGSVIGPYWVLTAAHCLVGETATTIDVVIGRPDLSTATGERIRVAQIVRHPNYNAVSFANDIALIRLLSPTGYAPVLLPADASLEAAGTMLTVAGWGTTRYNYQLYPYRLREVKVPVVGDVACLAAYEGYANPPASLMVCAGATGKDSCQGDSGGPLFAATAGGFTQVGIVSSGVGCGWAAFPGKYTSVAALTAWITNQTGITPPSQTAICFGMEATIVGTAAGETIEGTTGDDVIVGMGGDDVINGLGGNDLICGGDGVDRIDAGPGNDRVAGFGGNDVMVGGLGNDVLRGGNGDDRLQGGPGNDLVFGEGDDDFLDGGDGVDTVDGGPGTDTCSGETQQACELVPSPVPLCFGREATIVGTARGETINGTAGDDVIVGLAGGDTINGYEGDDLICGGGGNDVITPGPGINRVQGGPGNDVVAGGPRRDVVRGGGGDDILRGNGGPDRLFGGFGNDRLEGGPRNDYLDGGPGDDYLDGGDGIDTCFGEAAHTCELPAAGLVFESGAVHLAVSSTQNASHVISVDAAGVIADLDVEVLISHTWVGDLKVTLTHLETGTAVTIIDRPGKPPLDFGCSGNDIDATLDDEAAASVETQCGSVAPAVYGTLRPNNPLSAFDGENLAGTWRLTVVDQATVDDGHLEAWALHFRA